MPQPAPARPRPWPLALSLALAGCPGPGPLPPPSSPSQAPSEAPAPPSPRPSLAPASATLTATLEGQVFDHRGATLQVGGRNATTDAEGRYRFEALPALENLELRAEAPGCPARSRSLALAPGLASRANFGRPAPLGPLPQPAPLAVLEEDGNFLSPALELEALNPRQDGVASGPEGLSLAFRLSAPLSPAGAQAFAKAWRLWPAQESVLPEGGRVWPLAEAAGWGKAAPPELAPWAIAEGRSFRQQTGARAELRWDADGQGGRLQLPFPLPNTRPGAAYQLGFLAEPGPLLGASPGLVLGVGPTGLPPTGPLPGELLRAVVLEPEASLAPAPGLAPELARALGRRGPAWRFSLPPDQGAPKLVAASALPEGPDLLFRLQFDEALVCFDPVASEAGGRADRSLRGASDPLAELSFAFAEKEGELAGLRLDGEPLEAWDPRTQERPPQRRAELRLAAAARVEALARAAEGSVLLELPPQAPRELWVRLRGRAKALEGLDFWALRVGAWGDPVGNRRSEAQAEAEVLRQRR